MKCITKQMAMTHPYVYKYFANKLGYACEAYDGFVEGGVRRSICEKISTEEWDRQVDISYQESGKN